MSYAVWTHRGGYPRETPALLTWVVPSGLDPGVGGGESGRWREENNSQAELRREKGIARGCSSREQRKSREVVPQRENMLATRVKT